ncbi:MAG: 2,3-bisphosphoglycerate-independent phosphoglycerate mutase [Ruminococcaceae bacterium]|nr:2,3-bisphosphoglycerate-independent phosphoglycerate mutase [Oscillospiraceae bacterium]
MALIIMDGFAAAPANDGNAIAKANTPNLDRLFAAYPHTEIQASGMDVGLPEGQMGNSEVGHTNIGAGRIVYQELTRITKSIADGDFFENSALLSAMENCKENRSALHLIGLLSDGGVHSHITHLYGLLEMAKRNGLNKVYVHALLDGRDVSPTSGAGFLEALEAEMERIGVGEIATVMGRYYAMDRDNRWDRVEKAYDVMTRGKGKKIENPAEYVRVSYEEEVTDEFIVPATTDAGRIEKNDSVIFFNFRPDRAREITRAFVDPDFTGFTRKFFPLTYICMTQYDATMPNVDVAFRPQKLTNTFGDYISDKGYTQLRIAETEKYAHVTFFFNGGVEKTAEGEDRVLIPSPKVATYDLKPEMSAVEVKEAVLARLTDQDVIILNFANCDMVGHTGVFDCAVRAVETVDACVGEVVDAILAAGGTVLVTADHGNADCMYAEDGSPFTAHTTNPVPLLVAGAGDVKLRTDGRLADIAPTMLELMGLEKPEEMTGESMIVK